MRQDVELRRGIALTEVQGTNKVDGFTVWQARQFNQSLLAG
ncbi:hypothetical protein [Cohnella panacarvi]|nr:hypothetical protein [Cohnella panacarvi]